ncbi:hypothetical protein COJ46_21945 [Bacillus sp. AFS077874]|uniref:hypothetical protein n=1 Tax=unclassified Bacillus (in: firmicutes) TaxID=185979 RepID=UPI000BF32462|nr:MULTISPECIES: hypothetical protein [unclassified Bacillus (in: firmicutes)]PET71584.1 hypothetical protein CN514_06645 [Bacillus sp. AFS001701]PFM75328.1 hypothetical protein COJ46_21945 [Bacillus sp. AFS077874]
MKNVSIYHTIKVNEDFNTAANQLFELIKARQLREPNKERHLYLDIEGERGSTDRDMLELQSRFIPEMIVPYVTEIHMPLGNIKNKHQDNNLPESLTITEV